MMEKGNSHEGERPALLIHIIWPFCFFRVIYIAMFCSDLIIVATMNEHFEA